MDEKAPIMYDSRRRAESLVNLYLDVLSTSGKQLSQHTHVLSAILESIGDGVIVWDENERTILANRAMFELAGEDLINIPRSELLAAYEFFQNDAVTPLLPSALPYDLAISSGKPAEGEALIKGQKLPAEGIWIRVIAAPILDKNKQFLGVVSVIQNISERKKLERERNALATLITHDLKNHLGAWEMLFKLIGSQLKDGLNADYLELIEGLQSDNSQFLDLCNTLLELYRSDAFAGTSNRTCMELDQLVRSAVSLIEYRAETLGAKVSVQIDSDLPRVMGIPAAFRQGLHTLIQNAVEVVGKDGIVEVAVKTLGDSVLFEVKDNGPGMSEEMIKKLFDESRVAGTVPTGVRSTGFGLYLSRLLIEAQGGKIFCQSELGKGTTVSFVLPAASI